MEHRRLGKTGRTVSAIGFGAWAIGGGFGSVDDADSMKALHAAADSGVTLFDTADVYGDGRSERLIGQFLRERSGEAIFVATKMGRSRAPGPGRIHAGGLPSLDRQEPREPGRRRLDLIQLHCLPTTSTTTRRSSRRWTISFRRCDRELRRERGARRGGPQGDRIPRRRRRADHLQHSPAAAGRSIPGRGGPSRRRRPGRVPLASGLLTGKMTKGTTFDPSDHRQYNRHGEAFDVGETFAGVDYETGLAVATSCARSSRPAPRWPRSRCAGSS